MNATEYQQQLSELFYALKSGEVTPALAKEMTNAAGKMAAHAKLQSEHMRWLKEVPTDANRIGLLINGPPAKVAV